MKIVLMVSCSVRRLPSVNNARAEHNTEATPVACLLERRKQPHMQLIRSICYYMCLMSADWYRMSMICIPVIH